MPLVKNVRSWSLVLGVSLCGLGGYVLYQYFTKAKKPHTLRKRIPSEYVGYIIGRRGQRVEQLEALSGATIKFDPRYASKNAKAIECLIIGRKEQCRAADKMIDDLIQQHTPIVASEFVMQANVYYTLFAPGRTTTATISSTTGVMFEHLAASSRGRTDVGDEGETRKIVMRGTPEQIAAAREWINEKIDEVKKMGAVAKDGVEEGLTHDVGTGPFEVYISAMVDPSRFWLQVVGPKAQQLDQLVEEMTEFYNDADKRRWLAVGSVEQGDLVAATFQYDKRWYRAEVLNVSPTGRYADLYYVDYGDTDKVPTSELYELRMEYIELHFQAIECFLSRIGPVGETWSSEAIDRFEDWAHVAQWRKLSAKLVNYTRRQRTRAQRGRTLTPGVELFDVVDERDFNIGDELVRQGLAVYEQTRSPTSSRSSSSLGWERC